MMLRPVLSNVKGSYRVPRQLIFLMIICCMFFRDNSCEKSRRTVLVEDGLTFPIHLMVSACIGRGGSTGSL